MGKHVNAEGLCVYSGVWWKLALPQMVLPVHLCVVMATFTWAASRPAGGWPGIAVGVPLGFVIWTLFEYVFHRWLLHHKRYPLLRKIFWNGLHQEHHIYRQMMDPDHRTIHLAVSLPIVMLLVGSIGLTTESGWGLALLGGWLLSYCIYETLHWLYHICDFKRGIGKFLWVRGLGPAHTIHHFHHAGKNFGFITTFWDRRFGTYLPLEQTRAKEGHGLRHGQPAAANQDEQSRYITKRAA